MKKTVFVLLGALVVWSCSEDGAINQDDNGSRTFVEAEAKFNSLRDILIDLTTSEGLTREREFPTSGIKTFKGVHNGNFRAMTTTGSEISYVADVVFTLDFETKTYTGQLLNFTTSLAGFENPEGVLTISGSI
ncbi:MAG: hypothetical protein WBG90_00340 [Saonia sp.]